MDRFEIADASRRDAVVECLVSAFDADPVWRAAFPDPANRPPALRFLWGTIVDQALPRRTVWTQSQTASVAVWFPPGAAELSAEDAAQVPALLEQTVGARTPILFEMFARFDAARPVAEPHYYLDLFGTHHDHRGQGIGMRLLAHSLAAIDETGLPCYLESTNPANNDRYASVGFREIGTFPVLEADLPVTRMWRPGAST